MGASRPPRFDLVHVLWRLHLPIIAVAVLMTGVSLHSILSGGLWQSFSLSNLVGSGDPEFQEFENFMKEFPSGEVMLLAVETDGVVKEESQRCLADIVQRAEQLPAVASVASLTKVPPFFRGLVTRSDLAKGLLVSRDGKTAAVVLQMQDDASANVSRAETIDSLRRIVVDMEEKHPSADIVMTGTYLLSYEMAGIVRDDLQQFGTLGIAIALVPLLLSLGSVRLALYPLAVGVVTVCLTLGLSIWWGINTALNLPMLVLLTAMLAVATCIHLAIGGRDQEGHEVIPTVRRMLRPCVGIVGTTIAGFAAVGVSDMEPIRTFALLMSSGLALGLLLSLAVAFVAVRRPRRRAVMARPIEGLLRTSLAGISRFPRAIVAAFALLGLGGIALSGQLEFNLRFLDNFRPNDPLRRDYEEVEQKLAPMQTIELVLTRKEEGPAITPGLLAGLSELGGEFEQEPVIHRTLSLADVLGFAGAPLPRTQPDLEARLGALESTLQAALGERPLAMFLSDDRRTLRMSFLAYEGPSAIEKLELASRIEQRAKELFAPDYEVTITGLYYFFAHVAQQLLRDQVASLLISGVAVYMILVATLGSWRLATLGVFPSLIATCSCVGLMALLDVPFNMVTSMMLAIALGIAVDNTIHYLWQYRCERERGADNVTAVTQTHLKVGWACLLSSAVVALGFAVMSWSRFLPIAYFGGVTSAVMAIALAANLLFLPALLLLVDRRPVASTGSGDSCTSATGGTSTLTPQAGLL